MDFIDNYDQGNYKVVSSKGVSMKLIIEKVVRYILNIYDDLSRYFNQQGHDEYPILKRLINSLTRYLTVIEKLINFISEKTEIVAKIKAQQEFIQCSDDNLNKSIQLMTKFCFVDLKYLKFPSPNVQIANNILITQNYEILPRSMLNSLNQVTTEYVIESVEFSIRKKLVFMKMPPFLVDFEIKNGMVIITTKLYIIQYSIFNIPNHVRWVICNVKFIEEVCRNIKLDNKNLTSKMQKFLDSQYESNENLETMNDCLIFQFMDQRLKIEFSIQFLDVIYNSIVNQINSFPHIHSHIKEVKKNDKFNFEIVYEHSILTKFVNKLVQPLIINFKIINFANLEYIKFLPTDIFINEQEYHLIQIECNSQMICLEQLPSTKNEQTFTNIIRSLKNTEINFEEIHKNQLKFKKLIHLDLNPTFCRNNQQFVKAIFQQFDLQIHLTCLLKTCYTQTSKSFCSLNVDQSLLLLIVNFFLMLFIKLSMIYLPFLMNQNLLIILNNNFQGIENHDSNFPLQLNYVQIQDEEQNQIKIQEELNNHSQSLFINSIMENDIINNPIYFQVNVFNEIQFLRVNFQKQTVSFELQQSHHTTHFSFIRNQILNESFFKQKNVANFLYYMNIFIVENHLENYIENKNIILQKTKFINQENKFCTLKIQQSDNTQLHQIVTFTHPLQYFNEITIKQFISDGNQIFDSNQKQISFSKYLQNNNIQPDSLIQQQNLIFIDKFLDLRANQFSLQNDIYSKQVKSSLQQDFQYIEFM